MCHLCHIYGELFSAVLSDVTDVLGFEVAFKKRGQKSNISVCFMSSVQQNPPPRSGASWPSLSVLQYGRLQWSEDHYLNCALKDCLLY